MIDTEKKLDNDEKQNTLSILYSIKKRSLFIVKEKTYIKRSIKRCYLSFTFLLKS